jgi:hypothetical protein
MTPIVFAVDEVRKVLACSGKSLAAGPDGCPARLLTELADVLCSPLCSLFNMSMTQRSIPDVWKLANVIPVFKGKGCRLDIHNYRPISLTNVFCKAMEKLIRNKVTKFLEDVELISPQQSGFRCGHSTLSQLILTQAHIVNDFNNRIGTDAVYTDLSKAFDSLSHPKLLHKLSAYGLDIGTVEWIKSFICGRQQRVVVNSAYSSWLECTSGVPEGSVLGPLLFLIYINDLPSVVQHSHMLLYADDAKILKSITSRLDCILLQIDLDAIGSWCKTWQLTLNIAKCFTVRYGLINRPVFTYSFYGSPITLCNNIIDLGVIFDECMTFSDQCYAIVKKAYARANLILKCFYIRDRDILVGLYRTYVRPLLEYNSPVWSPHSVNLTVAIERVQKYFTKRLTGLHNLSYAERLEVLNLPSLSSRRIRADLTLMYKIMHNLVDPELSKLFQLKSSVSTTTMFTRGNTLKLNQPKPRTDMLKYAFYCRVVKYWNNLPDNICTALSLSSFKNLLTDAMCVNK